MTTVDIFCGAGDCLLNRKYLLVFYPLEGKNGLLCTVAQMPPLEWGGFRARQILQNHFLDFLLADIFRKPFKAVLIAQQFQFLFSQAAALVFAEISPGLPRQFLTEGFVLQDQSTFFSLLFLPQYVHLTLPVGDLGQVLVLQAKRSPANGFILDEAHQKASGIAQLLP